MKTQERSSPKTCRISTLFAADSLVKAFQSLESEGALKMPEELCSLRSLGLPELKDLSICSLKTFPDCYLTTAAGRLRPSSVRFRNWGTMSHGRFLTAQISVFPNPEKECFFSFALGFRKETMNSFMSWVGGKKALRDAIVTRLCHSCDRYVEVFGGGGWVLFHKTPGKFEVYNDFNPNLANLYRCVRDHPEELCEELRYSLNSRTDFEHIREVLKSKTAIPDIKRAAYFYQIIRESYASGLDSFGAQPHNMWRNFPLITEASRRLQNVVIENKDFEKLIAQYDRPNTIFYLDPPYYETEDYYEDVGFGRADHERLCNALMKIKGKFLLSYNDCPEIRELYSREGIMIESTTRLSNIAQRYDAGKQYPELLISNYDTYEEGVLARQLTLFDDLEESEKILKEHRIIWKSNVK